MTQIHMREGQVCALISRGRLPQICLKIAERMGVPANKFQLDFFGGTMFWVRPEALKPLRDLRLTADMPGESGLIDGDLPHALERVLPTSVLVAGYKLADSDGYGVTQARE
jgi:lipopolysaccharide biosynthesis protein